MSVEMSRTLEPTERALTAKQENTTPTFGNRIKGQKVEHWGNRKESRLATSILEELEYVINTLKHETESISQNTRNTNVIIFIQLKESMS